jgi:hypothetical protein
MSGCAVVFGLLVGLLLLIPGLCVMIQKGGWMIAIGVLLVGSAVIIWALSRRPRE